MRLVDLAPHWVGLCPGHAIGITFLCPHCRQTRIGVAFDVPIGGEHLENIIGRSVAAQLTSEFQNKKWHREGDTFDTLTLTPSIDTSEHGHWHGHITNGEAL
jgi:hypothetical protein